MSANILELRAKVIEVAAISEERSELTLDFGNELLVTIVLHDIGLAVIRKFSVLLYREVVVTVSEPAPSDTKGGRDGE